MITKMIKSALSASAFMAVALPAGAVDVPNTFQSGQPANAAEVNANFDALATAIDSAESTQFGSAYNISPSATADLGTRNVVVLQVQPSRCVSGGGQAYRIHVYYNNTNDESVGSADSTTTPAKIKKVAHVCAVGTDLISGIEYIYALPESGAVEEAMGVEVNEDTNRDGTFDDIQRAYDYQKTSSINSLRTAELVNSTEIYRDSSGEVAVTESRMHVNSALNGEISVAGETYSDVMIRNYPALNRTRFYANGVGLILEKNTETHLVDRRFNFQSSIAKAIYYRIDGNVTGAGALSGTPFESGGPLYQKWFQQ